MDKNKKEIIASPNKKRNSDLKLQQQSIINNIRRNSSNTEEKDKEKIEKQYNNNITQITKELKKLNNKEYENIIVYFLKFYSNEHKILIEVHYLKSTKLNPINKNIVFLFEMNEQYPDTTPKLSCQSSFIFPSLFDNRNLIKEVSDYSKMGNYLFASIITKDIPELIRRYLDDNANKIYTFIGEYRLDRLFVINDFITNESNVFYKTTVNGIMNYVVLTDIALLFFLPYEKRLEKGKLYSVIELKDIKQHVIVKSSTKENGIVMTMELNVNESTVPNKDKKVSDWVIGFKKDQCIAFEKKLIERIDKIKTMFTLFQKDNILTLQKTFDYSQDEGIEEIILYKEKILSQMVMEANFNENVGENANNNNLDEKDSGKKEGAIGENDIEKKKQIIRDLIELYQKAIEIYSAKCDPQYKVYIEKLRVFVEKNGNGL